MWWQRAAARLRRRAQPGLKVVGLDSSAGGTDAATKWSHRWLSDSPMCAGASPVALGEEVSGLLTRPRDCLNSVHCSLDLGVDWMSAHSRDHDAALA